jgi:hypothetical protein
VLQAPSLDDLVALGMLTPQVSRFLEPPPVGTVAASRRG